MFYQIARSSVRADELAEFAEAIVQLHPIAEGGRKVPLKIGSFIYTLHFRVSKDSALNAVEPIGGSPEIKPGHSGLIQVVFLDRVLDPALEVGCQFYLHECSVLIGKGELTRRWQGEVERKPNNLNPTLDEVRAWACDEEAWLMDQDEDVILCRPQYISILKELVLDQVCVENKRKEILKMLKLHGIS
ncbi:MAG: hypothetical protein IGS48_17590 [Oscillatoriales cyanobacterium C42_A2020_001]|nr:hypothetical protein [Leptolyngbyaceae cyanobacterium C42_A2020_001]